MAARVEAARPSGWEGPGVRHEPTAAQPAAALACPQAASADAGSAAPAASARLGAAVKQEELRGSAAFVAARPAGRPVAAVPAGTAARDSGVVARHEPARPAADALVAAARCLAPLRSLAEAAGPRHCRLAVDWANSTPCSRIHAHTIPIADNSTNRPGERRAHSHARRFPASCPCFFQFPQSAARAWRR
jgi:hypothetical protein